MTTQSPTQKPSLPFTQELLMNWACAVVASFSVAPVISIVDRSIIENASGKTRLSQGVIRGFKELFHSPVTFMRQPAFLLIWGVYGGTYIVGNSIDMICTRTEKSPLLPKFVGSSIANVTLSVGKDQIYTKMFGSGTSKKFPRMSYGLFAARDSLTILSGFSLPPIISEYLITENHLPRKQAELVSQLTVPCLMQIISSPLHLLGIDNYNRPVATVQERVQLIRKEYLPTVMGRIGRIFPAYGVGGVLNKYLRAHIQ